jgi:hypothetical protein
MNVSYTPRVSGLDVAFVEDRLRDFLRSREETLQRIREEPTEHLQSQMFGHSLHCEAIGFYRYGLGHPLDQVRESFSEAARARLNVFELRGTEETFPVVILTVDPTKSEDDPAFIVGDRLRDPPGR